MEHSAQHGEDSSSGEYLLAREDILVKDAAEKGDGSDSGVEFGGGSVGTHSMTRLTDGAVLVAPIPVPVDLQNATATKPVNVTPNEAATTTTAASLAAENDNELELRQHLHCPSDELQPEVFATEGQFSCDSSVLSFCSDENLLGDGKSIILCGGGVGGLAVRDCASEGGGSESSSVYNQPVMATASVKKRVNGGLIHEKAMAKSMSASTTQLARPDSLGRAKFRASSVNRVGPPALLTRDRARSKERPFNGGSPLVRANSVRRPPKPDSLPVCSPMAPPVKRMSTLGRTQSVRTPGTTPSDSGRWPYGPGSGSVTTTPRSSMARTGFNEPVTPNSVVVKTRLGQMSLDPHGPGAQSTFDRYATMPRRRRERSTDQKAGQDSSTRSSSISRDRATTTTRMSLSTNSQKSTPVTREPPVTPKMRSVVRRLTQKVSIFHEKSVQTALTNDDLENAFAGKGTVPMMVASQLKDTSSVGTQSEIRDREVEELRRRLKHLAEEGEQLRSALGGKSILLASVEQQLVKEREAKVKLQKELQCNSERVVAILESHAGMQSSDIMMESTDSLMMLETKVTSDSQVVAKQKLELKKMRNVCTALRQELDEALERERSMIAEKESEEMQEFLQIEKSVLTDAAKTEEAAKWQSVVEKKDQELKWLAEECRHLVRFCEQRRQENMGMQAKYGALEMKSKELLAQQGNAVTGASVALNSLGSRLEQLVEQLIASYNISEQELEDVVFHNEAFADSGSSSNGNGSCAGSPGDVTGNAENRQRNGQDLSPQRSHSFINVVLNAIRNATSLKKESTSCGAEAEHKKRMPKQVERIQEEEAFGNKMEDSDGSTDMLDSETEPRLMMENVLADSQSVDGANAGDHDASMAEADVLLDDDEDHSLNNLSQAISNRQQIEFQTSQMLNKSLMLIKQQTSLDEDASHASSLAEDMPSLGCDNCTNTQEIIEQVISVDNLITKLLKVMRIVQQDNDNCIQHLIGEKNKLQQNRTETEDKVRDFEDVNENLKCQLTTMTQQLLDTEHDLSVAKTDLQNCRQEIDKLNHHICELSTLCSNKENNNECLDNGHTRAIEDVLKTVMLNIENGDCKRNESSEGELYNKVMGLLKSNRELRAELAEQKRNPNMNWQLNAISDLKRLYEVIDSALEVLNATPAVIEQYPALSKLQKDLEETNFTLATTLPSYLAIMVSLQRDQNANPTTANVGGTVTLVAEEKTGASPVIDSLA